MHVSEAIVSPLEAIGQAFVVNAQQVQQGGLEIMDVDPVLDRADAKVIRCTICETRLDASTGHPSGEGIGVVPQDAGRYAITVLPGIAPVVLAGITTSARRRSALDYRRFRASPASRVAIVPWPDRFRQETRAQNKA